jgi:hypothetical protein
LNIKGSDNEHLIIPFSNSSFISKLIDFLRYLVLGCVELQYSYETLQAGN